MLLRYVSPYKLNSHSYVCSNLEKDGLKPIEYVGRILYRSIDLFADVEAALKYGMSMEGWWLKIDRNDAKEEDITLDSDSDDNEGSTIVGEDTNVQDDSEDTDLENEDSPRDDSM